MKSYLPGDGRLAWLSSGRKVRIHAYGMHLEARGQRAGRSGAVLGLGPGAGMRM